MIVEDQERAMKKIEDAKNEHPLPFFVFLSKPIKDV
jgi:hypothetical protein